MIDFLSSQTSRSWVLSDQARYRANLALLCRRQCARASDSELSCMLSNEIIIPAWDVVYCCENHVDMAIVVSLVEID